MKKLKLTTKFTAIFLTLALLLTNFISVSTNFNNLPVNVFAQTAEEESSGEETDGTEEETLTEIEYQISVKVTVDGIDTEGVNVSLSGGGTKSIVTSANTANNVFTELAPGTYTISVNLGENDLYELAPGASASQQVTLTENNSSEQVSFSLNLKEPEPDENLENIRNIQLPEELTKIGSKTTIISQIAEDDLFSVQSFTFDNPGVNKITYREVLNLSNYADYSRIQFLDELIDLETVGQVRFDASLLGPFNSPARISMSQINLVKIDPEDDQIVKISKDGNDFTTEAISYDEDQSLLEFDVQELGDYRLIPTILLDELQFANANADSEDLVVTTAEELLNIQFNVDLIDSDIKLFNNGEEQVLTNPINENGQVITDIDLDNGENRIRILAEFSNGETDEYFFTIDKEGEDTSNNSAANIFGIAFFIVFILLGLGLGGYYYYVQKKQQTKKSVESDKIEEVLTEKDKTVEQEPKSNLKE